MTQFELMFVVIASIFLSLIVLKVILEIRKDKPILTEEERQSLRTKLSHSPIRIQEGLEVGMTGGEWVGVVLCTPYGLIKYFDWKKEYPRKSNQVCTFYLVMLFINILIRLLIVAFS